MNIITGINKESGDKRLKTEVNLQPATRNKLTILQLFRIITILLLTTVFNSCTSRQPVQEEEVSAKSDVKIVHPVILPASKTLNFMAVTRYMQTNDIRTQVTGIVRQINCSVASVIAPKQSLFIIQPQEAAALQKSKFSNQILGALSDTVFSSLSGQIKSLNVQPGDFVQAGDVLATCIRANSMRIIVYIPVEKITAVEKLKNCTLILPDGSTISGRISGKLPTADSQDQTQAYIIEPSKSVSLAENINLNVQFTAEEFDDALFVPESSVLGNEEQTSFWVMKLLDDSTCIKVPVEKGLEKDSLIQLIGSGLNAGDRIVSEGGYGLPDSARVNLIGESQTDLKPGANRKSTSGRH
jgi:multidrug efflux pump subunit AcrA (membrane-fusion protein)